MLTFQKQLMKAMELLIEAKEALGHMAIGRESEFEERDRLSDHIDRSLEQCAVALAESLCTTEGAKTP